jgi:hypothetical protein
LRYLERVTGQFFIGFAILQGAKHFSKTHVRLRRQLLIAKQQGRLMFKTSPNGGKNIEQVYCGKVDVQNLDTETG